VNNRGAARYVFASSFTNQGFYSFIPQLVTGLAKVYILKGPPGSGKSTFIRMLGELMSQRGYEVEFWVSSLDPVIPDGVFIPQLDTAVVNGSLPQPIDPKYPGIKEIIINLGEYWDQSVIQKHYREIVEQFDRMEKFQTQVANILKEASWAKEEIRNVNAAHLDMQQIDLLIQKLSAEIIETHPGEKHYFAGVITDNGLINYIDELSASCKRRYIFKGPTGSGKSTVINALVADARQRGYFLEYFHCGLETDYLVMVIIRNLQLALIEPGHAEIALQQGDTVVDMTEFLDRYDSEEAAIETSEAYRRYESLLLQAQHELEKLRLSTREIKKIYTSAMDFERLERKREEIADEINSKKR
jgi:Putative periplasmic protein kinase ArgK and related GTPases of G3E family